MAPVNGGGAGRTCDLRPRAATRREGHRVRVTVDREACVGAGRCVLTAPGVFDQDDDGYSVVLQAEPVGADAEAARLAAARCPSRALRISLDDAVPAVPAEPGLAMAHAAASPRTLPAEPDDAVRTLPRDGLPTRPSPVLARWRQEAPATPLTYPDRHEGTIVTGHELAQLVLADTRFSMRPSRYPAESPERADDEDDRTLASREAADLLGVDGPVHRRFRQVVAARFTTKAVRALAPTVVDIVARRLADFLAAGSPADLNEGFAEPVSAEVHFAMLGVPRERYDEFVELFVGAGTTARRGRFVREVLAHKREHPGDDALSHLVASDMTDLEVEGLTIQLMLSWRDSVAYTISTAVVDLLSNPQQWARLVATPELATAAVDELLRHGSMFLTLFPRTPSATIELGGHVFEAGRTVAVSPVGANRDPQRFPDPDALDLTRDAAGQLAFGYGQHVCVGHHLARLEVGEALAQLVRAVPDLRLVEADQLAPMEFAHPVATYRGGRVIVAWEPAAKARPQG